MNRALAITIAVLVLVCLGLSIALLNTKDSDTVESYKIEQHEREIKRLEKNILNFEKEIFTLRHENDSLNEIKQKVRTITIREIDSVYALPFDGRADFWSKETARIDSVRVGYVGSNN